MGGGWGGVGCCGCGGGCDRGGWGGREKGKKKESLPSSPTKKIRPFLRGVLCNRTILINKFNKNKLFEISLTRVLYYTVHSIHRLDTVLKA